MKLNHIFILLAVAITFAACKKDNFVDTGKANGKFNGSMLQYLKSSSYDWDSTVLIIKRAGLEDLFEGNDPLYPKITFFGPTNHSIRQYLLKNTDGYSKISDIPAAECRTFMLQYVIPTKKMKDDFDFEVKGTNTGGTMVTSLGNNQLRVYRITTPWNNVPDKGPVVLGVESFKVFLTMRIASADIEPNNGVVHSLPYTFMFGDF